MSDWKARRFWTEASVEPVAHGHAIRLDGRVVRSPLKTELVVPSRALAQAVAAEWQAQTDVIDPLSMPLTRACNTALDKAAPQAEAVAEELAGYGASDLLCYRAEAPANLVERQARAWDAMLDWAADRYDARLVTTRGVMPCDQPAAALMRLRARVHACTPWELVALSEFVTLTGSLVLGLAVLEQAQTASRVWPLSRIDEDWQAEEWGVDEEEAERIAIKRESFVQAERFLLLLRAS